jgi:hypothetical protein
MSPRRQSRRPIRHQNLNRHLNSRNHKQPINRRRYPLPDPVGE